MEARIVNDWVPSQYDFWGLLHLFISTPTLVYSSNRIIFPILVAENSCHLPPDPGPCEAFIPSWFFNNTVRSCAVFIYGGCNGNKNRFPSYYDCQDSCNGKLYRKVKDSILIITLTLQKRWRTMLRVWALDPVKTHDKYRDNRGSCICKMFVSLRALWKVYGKTTTHTLFTALQCCIGL